MRNAFARVDILDTLLNELFQTYQRVAEKLVPVRMWVQGLTWLATLSFSALLIILFCLQFSSIFVQKENKIVK